MEISHVVIVTGASRGLGRALVEAAMHERTRVVALSRSAPANGESRRADGRLKWVVEDLVSADASNDGWHNVWRRITIAALDGINPHDLASITLINNAATLDPVGLTGALGDAGGAKIAEAVTVNLTAPMALTHHFVASFCASGFMVPAARRTVVQISSGAGVEPMPGLATYSTTKAALNMFVRAAQAEIDARVSEGSADPVAIVAISPGIVDTGMQTTLRESEPGRLPGQETYRAWQRDGALQSAEAVARRVLAWVAADDGPRGGTYVHMRDLPE